MIKVNLKFIWTIGLMIFTLAISAQEICDNGIDDDGDSLIDLNDDDCDCANIVPLTSVNGSPCRRLDLLLEVSGATSFQWYKDGVAITGYTNNSMAVTRFNPTGEGCYQVLVQHPSGCMLSEPECAEIPNYSLDLGELQLCSGDTLVIDQIEFEGETIAVNPPSIFTGSGRQSFKTGRPSDGCDIRVALEIVQANPTTILIDDTVCEGGTYINGSIMATEAGIYYDTLQTIAGCDSIIEVDLKIDDLAPIEFEAEICRGETYIFHDISETTPGIYTGTGLASPGGCDTTFIVTLTVVEPQTEERNIEICAGGIFELGNIYAEGEGTYETTLQSINNCDSLELTINITEAAPEEFRYEESICQGKTFVFRDIVADESGMYTMTSELGECDSLIIIDLEVLAPEEVRTEETICSGLAYEWRGNMYDEEGIIEELEEVDGECDVLHILDLKLSDPELIKESHVFCQGEFFELGDLKTDEEGVHIANVEVDGGCDEVYEITLTEIPSTTGIVEDVLCSGDTYVLYDLTATVPGTYEAHTLNVAGCDSTITVLLSSQLPAGDPEVRTICPGESTMFNGQTFDTEDLHTVMLTSVHGCDSLATLDLKINSVIEIDREFSICRGDTLRYHDLSESESGVYNTMVIAGAGCDSSITVYLDVMEQTFANIPGEICDGESFVIGDQEITEEGSHMVVLQNAAGCDSIVTLELTVLTDEPVAFTAEICEGESYYIGDEEIFEAGRHETTVQSLIGCDSTIVVDLQVNPLNQSASELEICPGDIISFYGQELSEPGSYTTRFENEVGCDSIVSLTIAYDAELGQVALQDTVPVNLGSAVDVTPLLIDGDFVAFQWLDEDGDIMSLEEVLTDFRPEEDTHIEFVATNINGCEVRARAAVDVELIIDIYIPNVITPDSDTYDSFFTIGANEAVVGIEEIQIFDRWGEMVHVGSHSGNLDTYIGWDGYYKNKKVEPAVFTYYAIFEIIDGSFVKRAGDLTVIR